jgi:hypothetical protein
MRVDELAAKVRRRIEELEEEAAQEREFLARLEAYAGGLEVASTPSRPESNPITARLRERGSEPVVQPRLDGVTGRRVPLSEKRQLAWQLIEARPGRWTTNDMRAALADRGVDPNAGTPVKNLLWAFAQDGRGTGLGGGVYEFPGEAGDDQTPTEEADGP